MHARKRWEENINNRFYSGGVLAIGVSRNETRIYGLFLFAKPGDKIPLTQYPLNQNADYTKTGSVEKL
jgi:hypothetical protein